MSVDPITKAYPELTPYQYASNRPIDGVDLDGLEFFKVDNTDYRIAYKPVFKKQGVLEAANNASHNVLTFFWNGTFGAIGEAGKSANNYFAGGYKTPTINPVDAFVDWSNEAYRYHSETPAIQQLEDLGTAATDLSSYEVIPSLIIAHKLPSIPKLSEPITQEGIIYERLNPKTGKKYIGQSESEASFLKRQSSHDRNLNVKHEYTIQERATPGNKLDVAEETHIRKGGGPEKKGGNLENKRYQMNDKRYRAAGGKESKPTN